MAFVVFVVIAMHSVPLKHLCQIGIGDVSPNLCSNWVSFWPSQYNTHFSFIQSCRQRVILIQPGYRRTWRHGSQLIVSGFFGQNCIPAPGSWRCNVIYHPPSLIRVTSVSPTSMQVSIRNLVESKTRYQLFDQNRSPATI